MSSRLRPLSRSFVAIVTVLALALPAGAQEAEPAPLPENPYERLAEIKRRQAEAAFTVDLLNLSAIEVRNRLQKVEAWVAAQTTVVDEAQAQLVEATLAANQARAAEEAKAKELAELEQLMRDIAIEAFIRPRQNEALGVLIEHDMDAAAKADVMLRAKNDHDRDVAAELAAAEEALGELRIIADAEAERAEGVADEAAAALDDLHRARLEQVALAEQIKVDLAATTEQLQLLGGVEAEAILAVQRETDALLARIGRDSSVPLVEVRGIRVHEEIAPALEALMAEAERDGIVLAGWGHRSTQQQVALRRQHCGGEGVSDADAVYGRPASSCSPPTAKPGTSMHELGLAVDFTHDGASISTRESPAFRWLSDNANDYGLYNLPSEPWHWSVNGD